MGVVTFVWLMITVVGGGGYLCMVDDDCVWAGMEVRVVTCVWLMITVVGVGG